jgi:DNA-directed RNA polymerase I, II, and III subunit RPABC3
VAIAKGYHNRCHVEGSTPSAMIALEDIVTVKHIDREGKKFDKVSRLDCRSENYDMELVIDVNTDLYPVKLNEKLTIALATSLEQGKTETGTFEPHPGPSLLDQYQYAMYGKVYKWVEEKDKGPTPSVAVYVSFGGLLMMVKGDPRQLKDLQPEGRLYLLMRKA